MLRFGFLARFILILMSALIVMAVISLLVLRWQSFAHPRSGPFLRIKDTAMALDLIDRSPPAVWSDDLRALEGRQVRFHLLDQPPSLQGLIHAPRLEAKLHAAALGPTGRRALAYTNRDQSRRAAADKVEGFLALAYARLPDGRFLVSTPVFTHAPMAQRLFGLPPGVWIGFSGAVVAALAVWGAAHETRPLRSLTRSLEAFDGVHVARIGAEGGAPDLRALQLAVNGMQERVTALVRERTLFVGAISHDLRTVLTRLQLRTLAVSDPALKERLEADARAMLTMLEDALAYARGSESSLRLKRFDLADLVASEVAERKVHDAGLPVEVELSDAPMRGDGVALRRVASNLLDNALKFGRSRVRVTVTPHGQDIHLVVDDDGPGIPPAERMAVLQPFHRVEGSRNRQTGGVGLGLAIADRIVRAHGGSLALEESAFGGSRARVVLPRQT